MKFTASILLVSVALLASANPVSRAAQEVWDPTIISPNAATIWVSGAVETVTWSIADAPPGVNNEGIVVFRDVTTGAMTTLADSFELLAGSVNVTVPVNSAGTAFITLFGDSGNESPEFTVVDSIIKRSD